MLHQSLRLFVVEEAAWSSVVAWMGSNAVQCSLFSDFQMHFLRCLPINFVTSALKSFVFLRVLPLSRSHVGIRACRALADGRLLIVNGLGVLEQFEYSWRDLHSSPVPSSAPAAATTGDDAQGGGEAVVEEQGEDLGSHEETESRGYGEVKK